MRLSAWGVCCLRKELNKSLAQELVKKDDPLPVIGDFPLIGYWEWNIKENTISVNSSLKKMLGYGDHELTTSYAIWQALICQKDDLAGNVFEKHLDSRDNFPHQINGQFHHKDGSLVLICCSRKIIEWDKNYEPSIMVGFCINVLSPTQLEKSLAAARAELKRKDIALQEVIAAVEHEKNKVKQIVHEKLSYGIGPIIHRLKKNKSGLDLILLEMIENALDAAGEELFSRQDKVTLKLSPREIQICLLAKNGLSVKEIAQFYNLSQRTIDKHRENIRKKLGLHGTAVNLVSFLRDLTL